MTPGTNTLTVAATDLSGNTATRTYEVDVTGTGRASVYDANGNLTSDGTRTFEWNANDQLTAVVQGTTRVEYAYNSQGYRVLARELTEGVVGSERRFLWADGQPVEQRSATGEVVEMRMFDHGSTGNTTEYYARDYLGSPIDVTDNAGSLTSRYPQAAGFSAAS